MSEIPTNSATKGLANKKKASVCFAVPLSAAPSQKEINAAYKELVRQITSFAESIAVDHNALILHTAVSDGYEDMKPVFSIIADPTLAETQTINKKIEQGKSSITNPRHPTLVPPATETDDEDDKFFDKPRVQAVEWTPPGAPGAAPAETVTGPSDEALSEAILGKMGRVTGKTKSILDFMIKHKNKEFTPDDIVKGTKLEKAAVGSWLAMTAKDIKAVVNVKRGTYTFDPTKVKVKAPKA